MEGRMKRLDDQPFPPAPRRAIPGAMTIKLICLDADDTLWHNMRHFNATQDALTDMLQPFADVDVTRERLIACEIRNLPLYGYGAKGFTLSMIEAAVELAGDQLSTAMI